MIVLFILFLLVIMTYEMNRDMNQNKPRETDIEEPTESDVSVSRRVEDTQLLMKYNRLKFNVDEFIADVSILLRKECYTLYDIYNEIKELL
jgi:hypothetical protein